MTDDIVMPWSNNTLIISDPEILKINLMHN